MMMIASFWGRRPLQWVDVFLCRRSSKQIDVFVCCVNVRELSVNSSVSGRCSVNSDCPPTPKTVNRNRSFWPKAETAVYLVDTLLVLLITCTNPLRCQIVEWNNATPPSPRTLSSLVTVWQRIALPV